MIQRCQYCGEYMEFQDEYCDEVCEQMAADKAEREAWEAERRAEAEVTRPIPESIKFDAPSFMTIDGCHIVTFDSDEYGVVAVNELDKDGRNQSYYELMGYDDLQFDSFEQVRQFANHGVIPVDQICQHCDGSGKVRR